MNVLQSVFLETGLDPVMHHRFILGAGDASPVLVPVVAALVRDRDDFLQALFHFEAVDPEILLIGGGNERAWIRVVSNVAAGIEQPPVLRGQTAPEQYHSSGSH